MAAKTLSKLPKALPRYWKPINTNFRWKATSPQEHVRPETVHADMLTDIGTRRIFSEEHDIFRRNVRKYLQEEIVPHKDKYYKAGIIPKEVWKGIGKQGMLGASIPAELGGIGADFLSACIVQEEISTSNFASMNGVTVHSEIVMPYICHYGTADQINKYIPAMTRGDIIGAIAMTEPGAGSDLQGIRTTAKKDGDHWILNGSKIFITNGINSDVVIVVARTDLEKQAAHGISLFLVDSGTEGYVKGKNLDKMGMKASDTAELFFEDVRLSEDMILGKPNQGFYYLMKELPQERLSIAVMAAAHCEFMFEETRRYVKERQVFGKPVANFQTVQHRLAELKTEIYIARTFVDNCIELHCNQWLDPQLASMAKYWTSDLQNKVADQCVQLHGGMGYMMEFPIATCYIDARAQPIYGGTNEVMKELIARYIVKG